MIGIQPVESVVSHATYDRHAISGTYDENQVELLDLLPFECVFLLLECRRSSCSQGALRRNFLLDKNVVDQAVNDMRPHRSVGLGPQHHTGGG